MIKPKEGVDYQLQDYGDRVELTSNRLYGMAAGLVKFGKEGYKVMYDSCTVKGNMYIFPAYKPKETKEELSLQAELDEYKKESRLNKSLITRLRNKIEKLEKGIE